ncbi:MAG: hypothetical protein AAF512_05860 [Pseudomonadota bacterium]
MKLNETSFNTAWKNACEAAQENSAAMTIYVTKRGGFNYRQYEDSQYPENRQADFINIDTKGRAFSGSLVAMSKKHVLNAMNKARFFRSEYTNVDELNSLLNAPYQYMTTRK